MLVIDREQRYRLRNDYDVNADMDRERVLFVVWNGIWISIQIKNGEAALAPTNRGESVSAECVVMISLC